MSDSAYLKVLPSPDVEGLKRYSDAGITSVSELIVEKCLLVNNLPNHFHVVEYAKKYIENNFSNKIGVEEIAKKVFVSQYHFSRIFKKYTHYSPYQYLLRVRLQHAKDLMNQTDLSIKEISYQSGFNSIDYFSAAFTRKYKVCPSGYRKMLF